MFNCWISRARSILAPVCELRDADGCAVDGRHRLIGHDKLLVERSHHQDQDGNADRDRRADDDQALDFGFALVLRAVFMQEFGLKPASGSASGFGWAGFGSPVVLRFDIFAPYTKKNTACRAGRAWRSCIAGCAMPRSASIYSMSMPSPERARTAAAPDAAPA